MSIETMPIETLLKDKASTEESLRFGQLMRDRGIRNVDGQSLESLMSIDKRVLAMIHAEMERRLVASTED